MWYLNDAIALAMDAKRENPELDFETLVKEFWAEMEADNH